MDELSLFNIYGNITRTMMEFHNELIKIFNLVGDVGGVALQEQDDTYRSFCQKC